MNRERIESKIESLTEEADSFAAEGFDIAEECASRGTIRTEDIDWIRVEQLVEEYELWYNQALTLISAYLPKREPDFVEAYRNLSSVLQFDDCDYIKVGEYNSLLRRNITTQRNLLRSIPPKLDAEELRVRKGISAEIATEEVHQAKELLEEDLIRPAGVVAGVAIERHLLTECEVSEREVEYEYDYAINALSEALYDAEVISKTQQGQIEYLAKVRNKCAHADEEEPSFSEVERLVTQTEDLLREI